MEMDKHKTDVQAEKLFDRALKTEQEFAQYLTAIVQGILYLDFNSIFY